MSWPSHSEELWTAVESWWNSGPNMNRMVILANCEITDFSEHEFETLAFDMLPIDVQQKIFYEFVDSINGGH